MPKVQSVVGDAETLRAVMCNRINEAISRNPGLFRPGRGRLSDFATRYGMMRTVAHRLLTGQADASPRLLIALAKDTNLPTDFFYGLTEGGDVESVIESQETLTIPVFHAPGHTVTVHPQMLSVRNPEHLQVVYVGQLTNNSFAVPGDYLFVEHEEQITSGAVYAGLAFGQDQPTLLSVTRHLTQDQFICKGTDQHEFTLKSKDLVFHEEDLAAGKLFLVGKVVGKINLFPNGVVLSQI